MVGFKDYLQAIENALQAGNATEHTHRPALKALLESLDLQVTAINEPQRIACGAPDFIITRNGLTVGYIEAKDVGKSLAEAERTDQLKRYRNALDNLIREGIDPARVHFVGNVMIDTLLASLQQAVPAEQTLAAAEAAVFQHEGYGMLTLHRPANVDHLAVLERLLQVLGELSTVLPLVFPLHPRTKARIDQAGLNSLLDTPRILCLPPLGYLEMLGLMARARLVLTDSGGIQEETTALGVPCLTLRDNTERPITVAQGTNTLVGSDPERIRRTALEVLASGGKAGRVPELWDGHAATRIATVIAGWAYR